jgi:hypothetical protein
MSRDAFPQLAREYAEKEERLDEIRQRLRDAAGWIEWRGGKRPLAMIEVELRDGRKMIGWPDSFTWDHDNHASDIVRYRVLSFASEMGDTNEPDEVPHPVIARIRASLPDDTRVVELWYNELNRMGEQDDQIRERLKQWDESDTFIGFNTPSIVDTAINSLERELAEAHTRLEANFYYNTKGERCPCKPGEIPDGIACRDETIKGQDKIIAELRAALAAAARDAERYRYLRNEVGHGKDQPHAVIDDDFGAGWLTEERLDEAIDAARAGKVS